MQKIKHYKQLGYMQAQKIYYKLAKENAINNYLKKSKIY